MNAPVAVQDRRVVRGAWWALFVVLALGELVVSRLHLPVSVELLASNALTYFAPMFLTAGASFLLAARLGGVERRFWGLLGVAISAVIVPEAYWLYYEIVVDARGPKVPSWFELGHLIGISAFYVLVVSMTEMGDRQIFTRLRFYLDVLGALILGFAAFYWWWTLPLFIGMPLGGWPVATVAALYAVFAVVMLVTTGLIVLGWKAYHWRSWERPLSAGFAVLGIGLLTFPSSYANWISTPVLQPTDPYVIALGFGYYLMFMAAVYRFTAGPDEERAKPWPIPEVRPAWVPMLYPTLLALGLVATGLGALRVAGRPGGFVVVIAGALLALLLIVRSWWASIELAHHRMRSITDPVSGAYNSRYLSERLPIDLDDARAGDRPLSAVSFDVVDFRDIVGLSGADAGDRLLATLVDLVRGELPAAATVYRLGRDEFVAVVPGVSASEAVGLARRMNARVGADIGVEGVPVALSSGVASFPEHASDAPTLVARAFASQQLARCTEPPDVVLYDAQVVDAADPLVRLGLARRQSHRAKLRALAAAVDARDGATRFHSRAVAELSGALALAVELPVHRARALETAALLHDVGKIGVAADVLLTPDALTDVQWAAVREHPMLSERLLAPAEMPEVLPIVRGHHERWDGSGYPDGLAGEAIPLEARMLALCDAFDALTNGRRWRPAISTGQALQEIERCAGTRYDPLLTETFSRMVVRLPARQIAADTNVS